MKSRLTPSRIRTVDPGDMLGKTLELGHQIDQGLTLGKDFVKKSHLPVPQELDWFGLGGSAIVGDLIEGLGLCPVPLRVWRQPGYGLHPHSIRPQVVYSYSGNTTEALQAFDEGVKTGQVWLAVSSGGKLASKAETANVPYLALPTGYPPRGAVGFGVGAFMALFSELFARNLSWHIQESVVLAEDAEVYRAPDSGKNPALALAEDLVDTTPVLYAVDPLLGPSLVRRACAQLAENAKTWSHAAVLPEMAHNEVEAFPALATLRPSPLVLFVGTWPFADFPDLRDPVRALLKALRIDSRRVEFPPPKGTQASRVLEGLRTMLFLDAVSVWLALILATDPMTIPTITKLKGMQKGA
jgi:bifunctional phosphoglucose/phosphomannose isomerase